MAKTPVMIRLSDEERDVVDSRAAVLGQSRAGLIMAVLRDYLRVDPSIIQSQMRPREDEPAREGPSLPVPSVSRETLNHQRSLEDHSMDGVSMPGLVRPLHGGVIEDPNPVTEPTAEYLAMKAEARSIAAKNCNHPTERRIGKDTEPQVCGVCGSDL